MSFYLQILHYDRSQCSLFSTKQCFNMYITCYVTSGVYFKKRESQNYQDETFAGLCFHWFQSCSLVFQRRIVFKPISCWNFNLKTLIQVTCNVFCFYIYLTELLAVSLYCWFPFFKYLKCIIALMLFMEHCKTLT